MVAEAGRRPRTWVFKRPEALGGSPSLQACLWCSIPQESTSQPPKTPWRTAGQVYIFLSAAGMLVKMVSLALVGTQHHTEPRDPASHSGGSNRGLSAPKSGPSLSGSEAG